MKGQAMLAQPSCAISTRRCACTPAAPRARGTSFLHPASHASHSPRRVACFCSKRSGKGSSKRRRDGDEDEDFIRLKFGPLDLSVSERTLWSVALPAGGFLLLASVIGPLVIAVAASALALGAAVSAGAVAAAVLFPLIALVGLSLLTFGGLTAGTVAAVGFGVIVPKLLSLAPDSGRQVVAVAGVGLGFAAVSYLVSQSSRAQAGGGAAAGDGGRGPSRDASSSSPAAAAADADGAAAAAMEAEVRQMARELRDFDTQLAESEERRRLEQWRRDRRQ